MSHHLHDRRLRAERAREEAEEARELAREARGMKIGVTILVTCGVCRAVNEVWGNGVPKVQCSGCGRILVIPPQGRPRMESR